MKKVLFIFEKYSGRPGRRKNQVRFLCCLAVVTLLIILPAAQGCPSNGQKLRPDAESAEMKGSESGEIVDGVVRIKIVPSASPLQTGRFRQGKVETGDPELDSVLNVLQATEIDRVFSGGGKYAGRRRRYGLHLWYDIRIGEGIRVEDAVKALSGVAAIEYAGPVYRIRLSEDQYDDTGLKR